MKDTDFESLKNNINSLLDFLFSPQWMVREEKNYRLTFDGTFHSFTGPIDSHEMTLVGYVRRDRCWNLEVSLDEENWVKVPQEGLDRALNLLRFLRAWGLP